MTTLTKIAHDAHEQRQTRILESQRRDDQAVADETYQQFVEFFGMEPDGIYRNIVEKDGIKLRLMSASYDHTFYFQVSGTCPDCGTEVWSRECYELADLGAMLEDFHPAYGHLCPIAPEHKFVGDRLRDLIVEIVRNELAFGG